jgi:hypothetical protein
VSVLALLLLALLPLQGTIDSATAAQRLDAAAATNRAAKTPRVFLALKKNRVTTKQHARAKVVVAAPGAREQRKLFGRVKVVVKGGGKTRSVLAAMADHRTTVALPKLPRGFYKVRAEFLGNQTWGKAHSKFKKLSVVKAGSAGTSGGPAGWPNASNTGVPAGVSLKPYTGSCTIGSSVTIDSKTINCPGGVAVKAANVVIRNSKVNGPIAVDTDVNRSWSLTLSDSEVDAGNVTATAAIGNGNVNITRANIHGGHNALQCEEHSSQCTITDSWIHGQYLGANSADHLAGIGVFGALTPCKGPNANGVPACFAAVHNSILCEPLPNSADGGCTADLAILTQFGPLHGALVQNNLFQANPGAAYCTYGGYNPSNVADHVVYTGNVFERGKNNKCAAYGAVTAFDSGGAGNVWSNNTWNDGTAVKPAK